MELLFNSLTSSGAGGFQHPKYREISTQVRRLACDFIHLFIYINFSNVVSLIIKFINKPKIKGAVLVRCC